MTERDAVPNAPPPDPDVPDRPIQAAQTYRQAKKSFEDAYTRLRQLSKELTETVDEEQLSRYVKVLRAQAAEQRRRNDRLRHFLATGVTIEEQRETEELIRSGNFQWIDPELMAQAERVAQWQFGLPHSPSYAEALRRWKNAEGQRFTETEARWSRIRRAKLGYPGAPLPMGARERSWLSKPRRGWPLRAASSLKMWAIRFFLGESQAPRRPVAQGFGRPTFGPVRDQKEKVPMFTGPTIKPTQEYDVVLPVDPPDAVLDGSAIPVSLNPESVRVVAINENGLGFTVQGIPGAPMPAPYTIRVTADRKLGEGVEPIQCDIVGWVGVEAKGFGDPTFGTVRDQVVAQQA